MRNCINKLIKFISVWRNARQKVNKAKINNDINFIMSSV